MAYGLTCINNSGQLTLSSDGITFGYIGKATLQNVYAATGNNLTGSSGYQVYVINWAGPILCAIGLRASATSGQRISSVLRGTGTQWAIYVCDTQNTTDSANPLYWAMQAATDIYVWGAPTAVSGFGLALYNGAGAVTADLTRRPLSFSARLSYADGVMSTAIPVLTKPAVMGVPNSHHTLSTNVGGTPPWANNVYEGVWLLSSSTTLDRGDLLSTNSRDDGPIPVVTNHGPANALLIEANGLT